MEKDQRTIIIKNARVSFPHLFEQPMIHGKLGSCGARLMLDPSDAENASTIKQVQQIIPKLIEELPGVSGLASDKLCLRQDPSRPEYEGMWLLSANSKKGAKPLVLVPGTTQTAKDIAESKIYAGCYVTAKVQLWLQDSRSHGRRVNAALLAIRFEKDGPVLDGTTVTPEEAIEGFDVTDTGVDPLFAELDAA